jgi:hypothetical protein
MPPVAHVFPLEKTRFCRHFFGIGKGSPLSVLTFFSSATNDPTNAGPQRPVFVLTCPVVFSVR